MVRDKDLRKWGRVSATIMTVFGFFLIGAATYSNSIVPKLEQTLLTNRILDEKMISRITDKNLRDVFHTSLEADRMIDQHLIDIARAFIFVCIGGSLLFFYLAVLLWRSQELALSMETANFNRNNYDSQGQIDIPANDQSDDCR